MTGAAIQQPVKNEKGVWYQVNIDYCPACGRDRTERTRMPAPKPAEWNKVYIFEEHWDYCEL